MAVAEHTFMKRAGRRPISLVVLLTASLVLLGWIGTLQAANPTVVRANGAESITITVSSVFAFSPSTFEVTPGNQVTITLEQLDSELHTFTLSSVANFSFTSSNTSSDLDNFFAAHHPIIDYNFSATAGTSKAFTFTAPSLGTYEFICLIAGHFQAGMHGTMGSGVSVGPPAAPGVPVGLYIITGGIVGLVILAIVLGFVIGQREGSRFEMSPERLGYAEPKVPTNLPPRPPPPFA